MTELVWFAIAVIWYPHWYGTPGEMVPHVHVDKVDGAMVPLFNSWAARTWQCVRLAQANEDTTCTQAVQYVPLPKDKVLKKECVIVFVNKI